MFANEAGRTFFAALRDVAETRLGHDHPCFVAVEAAARDGDAASTGAAQTALAALPPDIAAELMAATHKALRETMGGTLAAWKPGGRTPH